MVPWVWSLTVSILVYLDLRIYTPMIEPKFASGLKFQRNHFFFVGGDCSLHAKKCGIIHFHSFMLSIHDAYVYVGMLN